MKVAIYSRIIEENERPEVQQLLDELQRLKIDSIIYQSFYDQISGVFRFPENMGFFRDSRQLDDSVDFLISLGGDGTLLDTISLVRDKNIPVIGINFGRLGFLASIGKGDMLEAVKALVNRTFVTDQRSMIHLDANKPLFGEVP